MAADWIPLADAARLSGRSPGDLRRKILMGEIDAEAVDDDRQYLVRASEVGLVRRRRCCCAGVGRMLALGILIIGLLGAATLWAGEPVTQAHECGGCHAVRLDRMFTVCGLDLPLSSNVLPLSGRCISDCTWKPLWRVPGWRTDLELDPDVAF